MDKIESRWPLVSKPADLVKVTAVLKGKVPGSLHAQADMLDAAGAAAAGGMQNVVAVAGDAYTGEASEAYTDTVDGKPVEKTRKVPTLQRDYWALKA